ncbi:MAG: SMC-Scp complex subunit ScpB [Planctomycetota bacterium]|jgi:segregation and condensation protein B
MIDPQANDTAAAAAAKDADDHDLPAMVEAILFTTNTPMTAGKIAAAAGVSSQASVRKAVETLNARYAECGAAFEIKAIAGGFQMQTRPEFDAVLSRMHESRKDSRLSQAAVETLAIIAYRQPILRADLEAVRGVASGEVLRGLIGKQMVKIVGRADVLGRPMLYGTTKKFLEVFGLASLAELPNVEELRQASAAANADSQPADADEHQAAPSPEEN